MRHNIALQLSYDGTAYHGWQVQKNGVSVQQTIQDALHRLTGETVTLSGVGRTDAGVHARRYVANFHSQTTIPLDRLPLALNAQLPRDVAVQAAVSVPERFDARFDCTSKEYTYLMDLSPVRDPFLNSRAYHHPYPVDVEAMQAACAHFIGRRDFAAVRSTGTPVSSTVRTVLACSVQCRGSLLSLRVRADGFLYHMVRGIAGTLLYVGQGKLEPQQVHSVLQSAQRDAAGPNLPPWGLYMTRLWYENTPQLSGLNLQE